MTIGRTRPTLCMGHYDRVLKILSIWPSSGRTRSNKQVIDFFGALESIKSVASPYHRLVRVGPSDLRQVGGP